MTLRIDSFEYFDGLVIGDTGLGVLAETIPSTGDSGPSFLYNDVSLPADNGKEIRGEIVTYPSDGDLFVYEDGSFEFSNAPNGTYSFTYQLYVDGLPVGSPTSVVLSVGVENGVSQAVIPSVSLTPPIATASGTDETSNGSGIADIPSIVIQIPSASASGTNNSNDGLATAYSTPYISISLVTASALGTADGSAYGNIPSLAIVVTSARAEGTTGFVDGSAQGSVGSFVILPPVALGRADGVISDVEVKDVVIFSNKNKKVTANIRIKKVSL